MSFSIELGDGTSTTAVHYPATPPRGALLVLAHGAGAGQTHPFIVTTANGLATRGIDVVTFDFPYMHAGRRAPDRPMQLQHCFRRAIGTSLALPGIETHRLFIGGKSMGGRMATHLGAEDIDGLRGIVVLGYPLHPPGAPDKLRVAHLPDIKVPMLIVQGERDTFGTPAELAPHLKTIEKAPVTLHPVAGADHSLSVRKNLGTEGFERLLTTIANWITDPRL